MPVDLNKTKRIALNLPIELADRATKLAEKDRRSLSQWLRNAIEDRVIADERSVDQTQ